MANYNDLPGLTGRLKRAAIDAYMKDEDYDVHDSFYSHQAVVSEFPVSYHVSRPGEDGQGGGVFEIHDAGSRTDDGKTRQFQSNFDRIRGRVDSALNKWDVLPDPGDYELHIESLRDANVALSVGASTQQGTVNGTGLVGPFLKVIDQNSDEMSGGIIAAFKTRFLLMLGGTIGGHHGVTRVLGDAITAEREIWVRARTDVANAVENSRNALDAYARKHDADWKLVLAVIGAAVAGASAFVTGGISGHLAGAAAGLTLLKETGDSVDRAASKPGAKSFEELMGAFEKNLDEINKAIKTEEELIERNLRTNIGRVSSDPGFNLDKPLQGVDDDSDLHLPGDRTIIHNKAKIREITHTAMPGIAAELIKAKTKVQGASNSMPWYRDGSVGIGFTGPLSTWNELLWALWDLLGDLEWEVRNGAKTLELAIEDMGKADSAAEDALEKHFREIAQGSGYTPFGRS